MDASLWGFSGYVPQEKEPRPDPELIGWIIYPLWPKGILLDYAEGAGERDCLGFTSGPVASMTMEKR